MKSRIVITVPRETKARWVGAAQASGMKLADWVIAHIDGPKLADPANWPDPTYAEQIAELGRPKWADGLGDRATLALLRESWTPEKLRAALDDDFDLTSISNVSPRVANEIRRWLDHRGKNANN